MKSKFIFSTILLLLIGFITFQISCRKDVAPLPKQKAANPCTAVVSYSATISPIFSANCSTKGCHTPTGTGNGDFTNYAGVAAKADAPLGNGSIRNRCIIGPPNYTWMPAPDGLPDSLKQKIDCWLQQGGQNN